MVDELILAWQDPDSRQWLPVGRLNFLNNKYSFKYTKGAKCSENFVPFKRMSNLETSYESEELFPIFKNRLLTKSRPEYNDYLNWLDLKKDNISPFEELGRTGGIRATDSLQLFPIPRKKDERYEVIFFSHGIRHLPHDHIETINSLHQGSKLYLMKDIQNEFDPQALILRTDDPLQIVGYCPKFLAKDFGTLIENSNAKSIDITVVKVNLKSPLNFKLLCKFGVVWPTGFIPFEDDIFQTFV